MIIIFSIEAFPRREEAVLKVRISFHAGINARFNTCIDLPSLIDGYPHGAENRMT